MTWDTYNHFMRVSQIGFQVFGLNAEVLLAHVLIWPDIYGSFLLWCINYLYEHVVFFPWFFPTLKERILENSKVRPIVLKTNINKLFVWRGDHTWAHGSIPWFWVWNTHYTPSTISSIASYTKGHKEGRM